MARPYMASHTITTICFTCHLKRIGETFALISPPRPFKLYLSMLLASQWIRVFSISSWWVIPISPGLATRLASVSIRLRHSVKLSPKNSSLFGCISTRLSNSRSNGLRFLSRNLKEICVSLFLVVYLRCR